MNLEQLNLANFRGFEQIELGIKNNMTVIAGVNGSGKSAILRAIATAASYAMPKFTASEEAPIPFTDEDIHVGKNALTVSIRFKIDDQQFNAEVLRSRIEPEKIEKLEKRRDDLRFLTRGTKKKSAEELANLEDIRYLEELLKDTKDHFSFLIKGTESESVILEKLNNARNHPLVMYYDTSRLFSRLPPVLPKLKPFGPANAYPRALQGVEVSLNDFASWFRAAESGELGQYHLGSELLAQLQEVIDKLLPGFSELELQPDPPPRFFVKKDGNRFSLEQLSDGERGVLALAFDLTRRLAIANPESKNPVAEGKALVMIDEIELHLHPRWQRDILGRLADTFKNCQFIVTTHSPQVVGEARPDSVFLLKDGKFSSPAQSFGMDSNWILDVLMEGDRLDPHVKIRLENIFRLIEERLVNPNALKDAEAEVKSLRSISGNSERLQQAASLIERLKVLGK
jgi:predicted ATP-binding protein involved in virulence